MQRARYDRVRALLPRSVAATFGTVIAPALLTFAMVVAGLPDPQILMATAAGLALSCCAAVIGNAWWIKQPESLEISFGELMLWRWFRRHRAERTIMTSRVALRSPSTDVELYDAQRLELLHQLNGALEIKDPYTYGHSRRVERHAYNTGVALGLSPNQVEELRLAASLHDVGKIEIPDRVLRKPASLNSKERQIVEAHVEEGARMVAPAASPAVVAAVRHHHESWDGSGYPAGLQGELIPMYARIISVVDAYDAMTSARPYKVGTGRRDAVRILIEDKAVHFDPQVVDAFLSTLPSAIPVVAGLMTLLVWPARAMRRASAWTTAHGGGSIAGAVAAAGATAMVTTATFAPAARLPMEAPHTSTASGAGVQTQVEPSDPEIEPKGQPNETRSEQREIVTKVKAVSVRKDSSEAPSGSDGSKVQRDTETNPVDAGPDTADPDTDEPAADPSDGWEPHGDPQPDKGKECEPKENGKNGNGKGHERHCG
jgi:hypothetical protein